MRESNRLEFVIVAITSFENIELIRWHNKTSMSANVLCALEIKSRRTQFRTVDGIDFSLESPHEFYFIAESAGYRIDALHQDTSENQLDLRWNSAYTSVFMRPVHYLKMTRL